MNLDQAIRLLDRHLIQGEDTQWANNDKIELINMAIHNFMARIESIVPDATVTDILCNVVANDRIIKPPPELFSTRVVQIKWSSTDDFNELEYQDFDFVKGADRAGYYSMIGENFYLGTLPSESVTGGFKIWGPASVSLNFGGETLPIKLVFHPAIVLEAKIIAFGEDSIQADTAYSELEKRYYPFISSAYRRPTSHSEVLSVDIVKRYKGFRNAGRRRARTATNI